MLNNVSHLSDKKVTMVTHAPITVHCSLNIVNLFIVEPLNKGHFVNDMNSAILSLIGGCPLLGGLQCREHDGIGHHIQYCSLVEKSNIQCTFPGQF